MTDSGRPQGLSDVRGVVTYSQFHITHSFQFIYDPVKSQRIGRLVGAERAPGDKGKGGKLSLLIASKCMSLRLR